MKLKFFFDGFVMNNPIGESDMVTSLTKARDLRGLLIKQEATLSFNKEAYKYLRKIYDREGWDGVVNCEIQYSIDGGVSYRVHYTGQIFMRDIEWDLKREYAKTPIVDNSFYAKINNNKSFKIVPFGATSKNGVAITPVTVYSAFWYDQNTGNQVTDEAANKSYAPYISVNDYLLYMIQYISDNSLTYYSSVFNYPGTFYKLKITNGFAFRSSQSSAYNVNSGTYNTDYTAEQYGKFYNNFDGTSLEELLKNICKLDNLFFYIDYSTDKPTFRIEKESFFTEDAQIYKVTNLNDIKEKTDPGSFYSSVKFGSYSLANAEAGWTAMPEDIEIIGFNQEEYPLQYKSNLDNILDLELSYTTSTNVIQDLFSNPSNRDYDKDIILWDVDGGGRDTMNDIYNWITGATPGSFPGMYNFNLTNAEIAKRFFNGLPASLIDSLPQGLDERFLAYNSAVQSQQYSNSATIDPVIFDIDNVLPGFDTASEYDSTTSTFTAGATGWYSFSCNIKGKCRNDVLNWWTDVIFGFYGVVNSAAEFGFNNSPVIPFINADPFGVNYIPFQITGNANIYLSSGDQLTFRLRMSAAHFGTELYYDINPNSTVSLTSSPEYHYSYASVDPNNYSPVRYEFTHYITDSDWRAILENPKGYFTVSLEGGEELRGFIENIKRNDISGKAQVTLNAKKNKIK